MKYRYDIAKGIQKIKTKTFIAFSAAGLVLGAGGLSLAIFGSAGAAPRTSPSVSFFHGGSGSAMWSRDMSNDSDPFSVVLNVPDNSSYAGINLHHTAASLPASAPSFDYFETGSASGGAPRLVILSDTGCQADEYAYPVASGSWNTASQWDLMGSCGYHYNAGWAGVQTYFKGNITSVFVVSDAYAGAHTDWIDNIQYDGSTISQPSDNSN